MAGPGFLSSGASTITHSDVVMRLDTLAASTSAVRTTCSSTGGQYGRAALQQIRGKEMHARTTWWGYDLTNAAQRSPRQCCSA